MRIDIVTLFPELCDSFLSASILGRARAKNLFEAHCHQIRDYTKNKQKQTDDYPYGGGRGMVLHAQPIADCLRAVQALSLIHISEPTRLRRTSYAVFCLKKKKKTILEHAIVSSTTATNNQRTSARLTLYARPNTNPT